MVTPNVGLALTTPSLLDDGLTGTQGWSPCTSYCEDETDEVSDDGLDGQKPHLHRHEVHVADWPIPPLRPSSLTRPLSLKKRIVSEAQPAQGMDALGIFVDGQECEQHHQSGQSTQRRILSEPFAYPQIHQDEDMIDEYPFPLMGSLRQRVPTMSEEKKISRLRASFSLLQLDRPDPHRGCYYSPEHGAPSLAEQMAYASGLGSQCDWSSPTRTDHASSDDYYLRHQPSFSQESRKMASRHAVMARRPTHDSAEDFVLQPGKGAEVHRSWTVYNRSRNVNVTSDHEKEQDMDQPYKRCSTPARSRAASTVISTSSSPILAEAFSVRSSNSIGQPPVTSYASSNASSSVYSSASSRSSHDTCATSVDDHQQRQQQPFKNSISKLSPIEVERLFQGQLDLLTPTSVSYSPDLPERLRKDFGSQASSPVTDESATTKEISAMARSPNDLSIDDFGHLFQGDFEAAEERSEQEVRIIEPHRQSVPQTDFSPAIATPQIFSPSPLEALPSPMAAEASKRPLRHISGQFLAPPALEDGAATRARAEGLVDAARRNSIPANPRFTMPKSASTASVLSRPRPYPMSSSSSGLFSRDEEVVVISVKKRSAPRTIGPIVPTRKTSLEHVGRSASSLSHNSMEAFYNESAKTLLEGGERHGTNGGSSKPLSPIGVAQAKEASRIKAEFNQRRRPVPSVEDLKRRDETLPKSATMGTLPQDSSQRRTSVQFAPSPVKNKFPTFDDLPSNVVVEKRSVPLPTFRKSNMAHLATSSAIRSESEPVLPTLSSARALTDDTKRAPVTHRAHTDPKTAHACLPTLYLARTNSQRRKGLTGYEPTEPRNLALARLGFAATCPTRSSTVEALFDASQQSLKQLTTPLRRHEQAGHVCDPMRSCFEPQEESMDNSMKPPFPTPKGFVLVVEEITTTSEHVVVPLAR